MITYKQLTLAEIFEDCQNNFDNDKCRFLSLLDEAINLDEIVPVSFVNHFHAHTGRPRKHQLYPILKAATRFEVIKKTYAAIFSVKLCFGLHRPIMKSAKEMRRPTHFRSEKFNKHR